MVSTGRHHRGSRGLWSGVLAARGAQHAAAPNRRVVRVFYSLWSGWLAWGCFLAGIQSAAAATAAPQARNVLIPIYAEGHPRAVASIRIERVFRDHRRMGFFRVKALPLVVAEGVQLEVRKPAGATNLLAEFSAALHRLGGNRAVELRDFRFALAGEAGPRLQARRLSPPTAADPTAFLLEGVRMDDGSRQLAFPKATAVPDSPGVLRLSTPDATVAFDFSSGHFSERTTSPLVKSP